jgi:hypothetical protein
MIAAAMNVGEKVEPRVPIAEIFSPRCAAVNHSPAARS